MPSPPHGLRPQGHQSARTRTGRHFNESAPRSTSGMSPPEIRRPIEEIMKSPWPVYSPFAREHYGRGFAQGYANSMAKAGPRPMEEKEAREEQEEATRAVLIVLTARGFDISDDTSARITACTDLVQLRCWLILAATTQSLENLFKEPDY